MNTTLPGYSSRSFAAADMDYVVFERGEGPAVIVLAEMPGITPKVLEFAERIVDLGCTAVVPWLFGEPGRPIGAVSFLKTIPRACVAKEFAAFALDTTPPVTRWLRALAADVHERCGGPGIGALGMCWTGGFALGMMVDERMLAPVLSQPSLPIGMGAARKAAIHLSPGDLAAVKERSAAGACVMGLRFTGDPLSPTERFESLRRELGDAFIGVEIDSSEGNEWGIRPKAHSVLTEDLCDDVDGHPTAAALEQVLEFFRSRLLTT